MQASKLDNLKFVAIYPLWPHCGRTPHGECNWANWLRREEILRLKRGLCQSNSLDDEFNRKVGSTVQGSQAISTDG